MGDKMLRISLRSIFLICLTLSAIFGTNSAQQISSSIPRIAFVRDYSLNVYDPATDQLQVIEAVANTPFLFYRAAWSPDGTRLAYMLYEEASNSLTLYVSDLQGEPIALTNIGFAPPFNSTWLSDGRILYAVYSGERHEMVAVLNAYAIVPLAGAAPELLGSFEVAEGCGGGTSNPAESDYYLETSLGGYREVFALTPYGLVHDGQCVGAVITLTNLQTGGVLPLVEGNLVKGVVSADGGQVMGLHEGQLTIVNLADMTVASIITSMTPDQYIWQDENHIIYSNHKVSGDLLEPLSETEIENVRAAQGGFIAEVMPRFQANIFSIDLSTGTEAPLYTEDAFAIGRMAVRGDWLVFSQVQNADAWVQGMADGTITIESGTSLWDNLVLTQIYALNLLTGEITLVLEDGQQMAVAP